MSYHGEANAASSNRIVIYWLLTIVAIVVTPLTPLSELTLSHLCSLQLHSSASRPIMFVANNAWLLTCRRLTQIQLWSIVFQALPFHYSSKYKVGVHFWTQSRHSKHLLILGPKCLMHFSAELSIWHFSTSTKIWDISSPNTWCRNVLGPKCLRSEVSVHPD